MKQFLLFAFAALLLTACGPRIYKSAHFSTALAKHRTVAILPAEVNLALRPAEARKLSAEQIREMNERTSFDIQEQMYGWLLRRSTRKQYTVSFQDITKTNAKLKAAGIEYTDLRNTDRAELAKLLGVDAVLQDRITTERPMSEGAAIAVGLLVGTWGNTNKVETTINIHDGKSGDLLWKYDYEASGTVGSSTSRLVDALMRNASRKFPYSAK